MNLPVDILERLKLFCEANELAMLSAGVPDQGMFVIVAAPKGMSPEFASCVGAELLLHGITTGMISDSNEERRQSDTLEKSRPN